MCERNNKTSAEGWVIILCNHIKDNTKNKTQRKVMLVYNILRCFKEKKYCEDYTKVLIIKLAKVLIIKLAKVLTN
jgi:hypothetical protein